MKRVSPERPKSPSKGPASNEAAGRPIGGFGLAANSVLLALASYSDGRATRSQLAALTGYSVRKSTLRMALSALRTRGLLTDDGLFVVIAEAGRRLAGPPPKPKTSAETIAMWRGKVKEAAALALFDVLVAAYLTSMSREDLAQRAGVRYEVSTFRVALSRLRVLGLIAESSDFVSAIADLFPPGKPDVRRLLGARA